MARPTPSDARYGSINDAADRYGCSPKTIRRMIAEGEIRGYRLGKRLLRVNLDEIDTALRPIPSASGAA